jgi:hypothetical protein
MNWKDIAGTVAKAAPILGTLLGGPVGGVVGAVIPLIANALGLTTDETTPERVNRLLLTDPTAAIKLAELEMTHKIELEKLVLQRAAMDFADTASARQRQVDSEKATGKRDYNLYMLAWFVVLGFFGLCFALMQMALPPGQNEVIFMLFGAISSGFGQVLGFFFGSSKSSADKTQLLGKK